MNKTPDFPNHTATDSLWLGLFQFYWKTNWLNLHIKLDSVTGWCWLFLTYYYLNKHVPYAPLLWKYRNSIHNYLETYLFFIFLLNQIYFYLYCFCLFNPRIITKRYLKYKDQDFLSGGLLFSTYFLYSQFAPKFRARRRKPEILSAFLLPLYFLLTRRISKRLPPGSLGLPILRQTLCFSNAMRKNTAEKWLQRVLFFPDIMSQYRGSKREN